MGGKKRPDKWFQKTALCRFAAVVELELLLHDNPHKKLLMRTLELKDISNTERVADIFISEVLLTGQCTPWFKDGVRCYYPVAAVIKIFWGSSENAAVILAQVVCCSWSSVGNG